MAWFWFICFSIAALQARAHKKKLNGVSELERLAKQNLNEAETKKSEASILFKQAEREMAEANVRVEKVINENKVFHAAIEEVANLWINDSWKSIVDKLNATNYSAQKGRMEKVFETCRKHGIDFDGRQERAFYVRLESEWKRELEEEKAKLEQERVREIMREEQRAEKAKASELKKLEEEKEELEKKHEEHLGRIKLLKEMESLKKITEEQKQELELAQSENSELEKEIAENVRRKSMAELTKAGNVYVISNVGSFGDKVFKVGMTRRLIPEERIKELGDASVPFPFDIHMMIPTEDAPALEGKLHDALWAHRMNFVNDGKEFFRIDLQTIKEMVDKNFKGAVYQFKPNPEASQWRESEALRKQCNVLGFKKPKQVSDEEREAA